MSKHTPGPWFVDEANPDLVQTANGDYICEVNPSSFSLSNHDEEQCEANARLIAAIHDLLEFAQEVRRTGDTRLASMAIAVIAKATGETNEQ